MRVGGGGLPSFCYKPGVQTELSRVRCPFWIPPDASYSLITAKGSLTKIYLLISHNCISIYYFRFWLYFRVDSGYFEFKRLQIAEQNGVLRYVSLSFIRDSRLVGMTAKIQNRIVNYCPEGAFCVGRAKKSMFVRPYGRLRPGRPDSVTLDLPEISKFVAK